MEVIKSICPVCHKEFEPVLMNRPDFTEKYDQWRGGTLIQRVWPQATDEEREQVLTGICSSKCWLDMLGPEE